MSQITTLGWQSCQGPCRYSRSFHYSQYMNHTFSIVIKCINLCKSRVYSTLALRREMGATKNADIYPLRHFVGQTHLSTCKICSSLAGFGYGEAFCHSAKSESAL